MPKAKSQHTEISPATGEALGHITIAMGTQNTQNLEAWKQCRTDCCTAWGQPQKLGTHNHDYD